MQKTLLPLFIVSLLTVLSACADLQGQNLYNANEVGKASDIVFGKIIAVHKVKVQEHNSGAGSLAGATAGGVAGANVGNGNGSVAALIAGAIIGGIAGSVTEKAMSDRIGIQYVIRKTNGKIVSIVQNVARDDKPLAVGQHVMIQTSGEYQKASNKGVQGEQYQRVLPVEAD